MISRQSIGVTYPVHPLGSLVEFLDNMRKPVKEADRKDGIYPYYGANGQQSTIDSYIFDEPLLLLAEDGGHFDEPERGIAYRISGKTWVNNHAHVLRPKKCIDINFLCRVLENYDVSPYISGSTRGKLTKGQAELIEIPLPPLDEQRRIAGILDQADALRQQRKTSSVQLNRLLRSSFVYLFGDPISNSRGWALDKLGNVGELERGVSKHRPRNDPVLLNGVYPLVQTGDIANADGYVTSYRSTYSELGLKQSRLWPKGTLCITIAANIGDAAILTFDACFPDSIVGFVPSRSVTSSYIQYLFSFLKQKLEDDAPSFAQKNINLSILRDISVPVPSLDAQNKFENIVEAIHRERERQNSFFDGIEVLFSSLQYRAFNGQL